MNWIFVAIVSGSILASGHATKEECLGRKAILEEQKVYGACVEAPKNPATYGTSSGNLIFWPPQR